MSSSINVPRVVCPVCGVGTRAPLPGEAQGDFGPRLTAFHGFGRLPDDLLPRAARVVEAFLQYVLCIAMSLGQHPKSWEQASTTVAQPGQSWNSRKTSRY